MFNKKIATLVLACFVSVSFCVPAVLAQAVEVFDLESRSEVGDYVVVVNAEKVKLFGTKADTKEYQSYSHYPGGQKITSYEDMKAKRPERIVELAVKRMLPKNKIGRHMFKKLKVVCGPTHEFAAQQPVKIEL